MTWWAFSSRFSPDPKAKAVQKQRQRDAVRALAAACARPDAAAIAPLLSADVEAVVDGGGTVPAPTTAVRGRAPVSELIERTLWAHPGLGVTEQEVNGAPGVVLRAHDTVVGVISIGMRGAEIAAVWVVVNPEKLGHWDIR